jgi:hypothetical protein
VSVWVGSLDWNRPSGWLLYLDDRPAPFSRHADVIEIVDATVGPIVGARIWVCIVSRRLVGGVMITDGRKENSNARASARRRWSHDSLVGVMKGGDQTAILVGVTEM